MKDEDVEVHKKRSFRHEMELGSEVKDLWKIFDSKPTFRADMDASGIDDVARSF